MMLVLPSLVLACTPKSNVWSIDILKGPLVSCVGATTSTLPIQQTCQSVCDLVCTSANVVYFGIGVVIWIALPIMFAWGGLLLILSRGNTEGTGKAKKMLTGTVIGLLIVLCAYLIVYTFVKVIGISGVGGFSEPACQIL